MPDKDGPDWLEIGDWHPRDAQVLMTMRALPGSTAHGASESPGSAGAASGSDSTYRSATDYAAIILSDASASELDSAPAGTVVSPDSTLRRTSQTTTAVPSTAP